MSFLLVLFATDGLYLRLLQHLLPTGLAWRTTIVAKTLRKFFEGLSGSFQNARDFVDLVYADMFPATTRELAAWEGQFGIEAQADEQDRRDALAGAWQAQGGQSPRYLQDTVRAAGFDVYLHEWWIPPNVAPRTARNPHTYTQLLIGQTQCGNDDAQCGELDAMCNRFSAATAGYLVNKNLTDVAPPPIPADPDTWRYFIYWGAATFPDHATVPAARREEFEALLLKLCPTHLWIVTLVDYV